MCRGKMVEVKKIKRGKKEYYYLVHSYRSGKSVLKKEKYLGEFLPKNIEIMKKEFMQEFYFDKYLKNIDLIKKNFDKELRSMPKSARKKELETFGVKFTYNTQRIEGSTLNLKETANLLLEGISPGNKPLRDIKETELHRELFSFILDEPKMNSSRVLLWHKDLFGETKKDIAGKIRNHGVKIAGSRFVPPSPVELESELRNFFNWYLKNKERVHPVQLAALVHFRFVTIHPFSDGNGRISRLMMNFVLKDNNYPLMDIEYSNRSSYYNALQRSNLKNDESIFLQWFLRNYIKKYREYLR